MSRTQLQRALLDTAAILSSAANIARRAAATIDVSDDVQRQSHPQKHGKRNTVQASSSAAEPSRSTLHAHTRAHYLRPGNLDTSPWPSQSVVAAGKKRAESRQQKEVASTTKSVDTGVREQEALRDGHAQELAQAGTADKHTITARGALLGVDTDALGDIGHAKGMLKEQSNEASSSNSPSDVRPDVKGLQRTTAETTPGHVEYTRPEHTPPSSIPDGGPTAPVAEQQFEEYDATKENLATPLRPAKVPSSRIARLLHYGSLGAGLAWGAAGSFVRGGNPEGPDGKQFMSDDNVRRLVDKLSTMRGAALKLGQFMSIQDSNLLPEQIEQVMLRVQNSAHYMPQWQMEQVMRQDLGSDWRSHFDTFNDVPFASASIGQVHAATLSKTHVGPLAGQKVAVKVQFPGVRESIGSDLSNLRWLVAASALLPRGLFLDNTIRVMRRELDDECNYEREKDMCKRFGDLLNNEQSGFAVPRVVDELCSPRVLTCEMMRGRPLTQASRYSQEKRDHIARAILDLSLRELFTFRLMQTDPNWTNFLYNERTEKIELIDFGATREYSKEFMDDWLCMLRAAISSDRKACIEWSQKVGYLTGDESEAMRSAHVDSMVALGEPFRPDAPNPYPFAGQTITDRVRAQIPLMLRERLTPPPEPTYSLNRKLSGAFLLCARLKANINCSKLFEDVTRGYKLSSLSSKPNNTGNFSGARSMSTLRSFHTTAIAVERSTTMQKKRRLVNLADRWPRHIFESVEQSLQKDSENDGSFVTLAADPKSPSIAGTPETSAKNSKADLRAESVGGQNVRPSDAAENPTTAREESLESSTNVAKQPVTIRGVNVPRKPDPPGPEDCCMSGCARCVYDLYAEDLQDYQQDLSVARSKLVALEPPFVASQWDETLLGPIPLEVSSQGNDSENDGRTAEQRAQDEVDAVIGQLDPSMRAFLQLERSLKKKGKHPSSSTP